MQKNQTSRSIGDIGEEYVCGFLRRKGYRILARNFTIKGGEIDIIAEKDNKIAFVEVKTRKKGALTSGESAVTYTKRQRLIKAARVWLNKNSLEVFSRFDVAAVEVDNGVVTHLKYYVSAFDASQR